MSYVARGPSTEEPGVGTLVPEGEAELEPYTIKCTCHFEQDDGATVLCEECDTWQHIECYYPTKVVPEVHICADCQPRAVDPKRTGERSRRRREQNGVPDRRGGGGGRRSVAKAPKKKPKDLNQLDPSSNGGPDPVKPVTPSPSDRKHGAARDQPPPAKRPKTTHRASTATPSQTEIRTPVSLVDAELRRAGADPADAGVSPHDSTSEAHTPPNGRHAADYFAVEEVKPPKEEPEDSPPHADLSGKMDVTSTPTPSSRMDTDALPQDAGGPGPPRDVPRSDIPSKTQPSPEIAPQPRSGSRPPFYRDASMQSEPTQLPWYEQTMPPPPRKAFLPLTKRILKRCHQARLRQLDADSSRKPRPPDPPSADAPAEIAPPPQRPPADLHVQLPPSSPFPVISPSTPSSGGVSTALSPPVSAAPSALISPSILSSVVQPSPAKKKLSLSDYVSRRSKIDPSAAEKPAPHGSPTLSYGSLKRSSTPEDGRRHGAGVSTVEPLTRIDVSSNPSETVFVSGAPGDPRPTR